MMNTTATARSLIVRLKGRQCYLPIWHAMQTFVQNRTADTTDEVWLLEHDPVYTQGQNGKPEHLLNPMGIPVINTDRGGQITYHGPGQLMIYLLMDLRQQGFHVRSLVTALENSVIDYLKDQNVMSYAKKEAPGIYTHHANMVGENSESKISSIGLRIRKGCSYHGAAFNIAMDLSPFQNINPCGFSKLNMTDCRSLGISSTVNETARAIIPYLMKQLRYNDFQFIDESH